jgi:hypothetical protein
MSQCFYDERLLLFKTKATATVLHSGVYKSCYRIESAGVSITITASSSIQPENFVIKNNAYKQNIMKFIKKKNYTKLFQMRLTKTKNIRGKVEI